MKKKIGNENKAVIVFAADENVVLGLCISIYTLLSNISKKTNYLIIVVDAGIKSSSKKKLNMLFEKYENASVTFIDAPTCKLESLVDPDNVGRSAYLALLVPDVIDERINKFIYVDSDVIIEEDIKLLYDVEMNGNIAMAVQEYLSATMMHASRVTGLPDIIECNPEDPYFNSGVMIVDAEKWRNSSITKRAINMLSKYPNKLTVDDQDALNGVLYGEWSLLDPKWNIQLHWKMEEEYWGYRTRIPKIEEIQGLESENHILSKKRGIFHFNNRPKPWRPGYIGPFRDKYRGIIKKSQFINGLDKKIWMVNDLVFLYQNILLKRIYDSEIYECSKYIYSGMLNIRNRVYRALGKTS